MRHVVLFRKSLAEENEIEICQKYFPVVELRSQVPPHSLVIGRYSVLPYYKELEDDLKSNDSCLINSYEQHRWIANFEYYDILKRYTPETWDDTHFYQAPEQAYVVKGRTNSRKFAWNRLMFAKDKREALRIAGDLMNDGLIGEQGIIYRKYVPLEVFETGINGLPFSEEFRFFFYKDHLLCYGFYWSIAENIPEKCDPRIIWFAQRMAKKVAKYVNFFVLDIALTLKNKPILIEINDGQCSGLSECKAEELYLGLKEILC